MNSLILPTPLPSDLTSHYPLSVRLYLPADSGPDLYDDST